MKRLTRFVVSRFRSVTAPAHDEWGDEDFEPARGERAATPIECPSLPELADGQHSDAPCASSPTLPSAAHESPPPLMSDPAYGGASGDDAPADAGEPIELSQATLRQGETEEAVGLPHLSSADDTPGAQAAPAADEATTVPPALILEGLSAGADDDGWAWDPEWDDPADAPNESEDLEDDDDLVDEPDPPAWNDGADDEDPDNDLDLDLPDFAPEARQDFTAPPPSDALTPLGQLEALDPLVRLLPVRTRREEADAAARLLRILVRYPHSASLRAIYRQLEERPDLELLEHAAAIKAAWEDRPWMWARRSWLKNVMQFTISTSPQERYWMLWPLASQLAQDHPDSPPDDLLDSKYDEWLRLAPGEPGHCRFLWYLRQRPTRMEGLIPGADFAYPLAD